MEQKDTKKLLLEIRRLRKLVYYDDLTGLLNRRGFKVRTERIFNILSLRKPGTERRTNKSLPLSVVFIDIDDFKKINDSYGHKAGDEVLKNVAMAIKTRLRKSDIYARWGGEEFVAALPGANIGAAQKVAESLRRDMEKLSMDIDGQKLKITISLGIVDHNSEIDLADMLIKADKAMYEAKQKGKNRIEIFIHE